MTIKTKHQQLSERVSELETVWKKLDKKLDALESRKQSIAESVFTPARHVIALMDEISDTKDLIRAVDDLLNIVRNDLKSLE